MPRIPFTDLASSPEFKALPPEDQQVVATGYWDDVAAERPDQAEFYQGLRDASKSLLDTKAKRNEAPPVQRRFLDAQVRDLAFDLSLGDELAQGRLTQEGYAEALKVRETESAQRQAQLDKTRDLFSDDPKKQKALALRLDGLEQTAITGGVFGSKPFTSRAWDSLTVQSNEGMVSSSKDAYAALKEQTAKDYGLEPDEVEDLVKHRLGFQDKPVSMDAAGNPFIKPDVLAQGPDAVKDAILKSELPWSEKQRMTEKDDLAERMNGYYKSTVQGVQKNHPELYAILDLDQVQDDPKAGFSLIQAALNKGGLEKFAGGITADFLGTAGQIAPMVVSDPVLNRGPRVLPTVEGSESPDLVAERRKEVEDTIGVTRRAQESINQLSQEFYKNQGTLWGVDASAYGSGAGSVLTAVGAGLLTGGASIPVSSARVATMGPTALRMLNGANSVMKASPSIGLAMAKTGTSTYEQAIKSGMSEEEAGKLATLAGATEGVITGVFSLVGAGGLESVGEQLIGTAARQAVRESAKSGFRTFGEKMALGVTSEQFEEGLIAAFDSATVQARINPNMTVEDFQNTLRETALVTLAVSGPTIGMGALKETLAEKATYEQTDDEVELRADLNLADAVTTQPGEANIPPAGQGPANAAPNGGAVAPGAPAPVAPGGTQPVAPAQGATGAAAAVPGVQPVGAAQPVLVRSDAEVDSEMARRGLLPPNPMLTPKERQADLQNRAPDLAAPTPAAPPSIPSSNAEFDQAGFSAAPQWDQSNRTQRQEEWFDGANVNEAARAGFSEASANGGNNLQAHGMAKAGTLSGAVTDLLTMLRDGLNPDRRGGRLDSAPLTTSQNAGAGLGTASGTSYRDGPFILVARPGQTLQGNLDGLGAVLVNEAHPEIAGRLRELVQQIRPDLLVDTYANAGTVAAELNRPQGQPVVPSPAVQAQEGTAQREGQGSQEVAEEAPAETFREPEPTNWSEVFEALNDRDPETKQVDTESPKFKELVAELKNNRVAEAAGKLEQRKADIVELEQRIAKERKERNEKRKEQNRFRMKNKPLDEHQEKIKRLTGHGHGFSRGIKDWLIERGLDPKIEFNKDWREVALQERAALGGWESAKTKRIQAQFDKLTPEAKEVVEAFHKMGKKPVEEKESLEFFWNTDVGKGIQAYGGLKSKTYFTDRGLPVPNEYDGLSERVPPHIGTAIFKNSDTVGSVDQVATAAGLTVNEFWSEFWDAVAGISKGKDATQDDYNERKQREAEDREIAFAEQQLKALAGDAQTVDLREVRDGDKFTLDGVEYSATKVEADKRGQTQSFTLRGDGPLTGTEVTEDFFAESVTPTEGSLAHVDPAEIEAIRIAQEFPEDFEDVTEPAPTATEPAVEPEATPTAGPVPYSPEALKETFDVSDEQAVAMDALVQAMGLDTSRIQLQRGGVPSDAAMRQEMDARVARHTELEAKHKAGTITPEETAEAERLVTEAAKAAGFNRRGVRFGFYVRGVPLPPSRGSELNFGPGYYVAEDATMESTSASGVSVKSKTNTRELQRLGIDPNEVEFRSENVFVKAERPLRSEFGGNYSPEVADFINAQFSYDSALQEARRKAGSSFETPTWAKTVADLIAQGRIPFDSVRGATGRPGMSSELVVQNPSQIKSADPFTGVPLNQRFNQENPSILYQETSSTKWSREKFDSLPDQSKKNLAINIVEYGWNPAEFGMTDADVQTWAAEGLAKRAARIAEENAAEARSRAVLEKSKTAPPEASPVTEADLQESQLEDDGYFYHVTTPAGARAILKSRRIASGKRQSMADGYYAEYSRGKVFFTDRGGVSYWQGTISDHLEAQGRSEKTVTIRIPKHAVGDLKVDEPGTRDAQAPAWFSPENVLFQNQQGPAKGSFEQLPETGAILLRGLASPDVSTGVHEIAHAARRTILNRDTPAEARAGITDADIAVAEEWAGAKDGVWTRAAEEKFARGWERYLRDGKSPVAALQGVFDKMAAWLRSIYVTVAGSPIDVEISPEMRAVFDKLVSRTLPQPQAAPTPAPQPQATTPPSPAEPTPPQTRPVQPGMAEVVSTQNAATDAWREANGFPPIFKNNPVTFTQYWQDAQKLLKQDPDAGKKLVARMKRELFQPDTSQVMLILNEMLMAKGAMERALYERNLQGESATADQIAAVNDTLAYYAEMTLLNSRVGSIQATAFGARKVFVTDELDIGVIAGRIQHAQGGKKLSKEQSDELEAAYAKIKAFEEREKVREAEAAEDNAQQVFENMVLPEFKKSLREGQKQGEKPLTTLQRKAQESREWLRQNIQGRANMNFLPAQEAYHVAVVGVSYIVDGASAIGPFTTRLIKDFGKRYLPFVGDIYKKSQELHQAVVPKAKKIKPRQEILDGIDPGEMVNGKAIYQLVRYYVNEGLQTFEEVMTAVHTDLRQSHPNLTMREVHDAFSNYGITTQPNQEKDAKTARKYREMARYSSQLEDAMAKSYPKKTGPQRDPQEQEVRDLAKQVRDTIRKFNLRPKNDKEQLKSTFDAIKTRLRNEFEDYDTAVKKGEERKAREPQKFTAEEEAELKDLRQKRDDRKKDYEAIFKKKGLTTEQRIERMEALLDRRIEEERKMLEEGILKRDREMQMGPWTPALRKQQETLNKLKADRRERQKAARPKKPEDLKDYERKLKSLEKRIKEEEDLLAAGLTARQKNFKMGRWTPQMAEMQARLDALRDDRRELAKKQAPKKSEEQTAYERSVRAIEAAIQRYNDIINAIKKPGKPTFSRTLDAEMKSLIAQRDALRDAADAVLEADPERKDKRKQDLLKVLNKSINEITRKIQDGDFSTKARKPGEFDKDPDVVKIRAARDLLNKTLAAMRKVDPDAAKKQLRDMIAKREAELSKGITLPDTEADPFAGDEEIKNLRTALDLLSDIKRIKTSTAKIQARLDAKDYTKSVKPTPKTSKAREDAIVEHNRLKSELNRMVIQTELDNRSFGQLVADRTNDLLFNVSRTLMTSADAGTIGRQTQLVAFTRPGVWAKSLPSHFAFAKKHAERVQARVENHPDYDVAVRAKMNLGSWQEGATFDQMNEEMRSEILRLIPWVGKVTGAVVDASIRAYVSGINSVRMPYFSLLYRTLIGERKGFSAKLTNKLGGIGLGTQKEIEYLARHVEIMTGRGNLGAAANSADFLSKLLFSPRYWLSRLQVIGHFPVMAVDLMTGFKLYPETRAARKVVAMEYARMAIGVAVYYNFLSMVKHLRGWDDDEMYIEEDPRSSDFGKVKIGNTRIDPMAGMLQNLVFVSRTGAWMLRGTEFGREAIDGDKIVGGKLISMRDAVGNPARSGDTMGGTMLKMIQTKLAPWPSAIWNVAAGEDAIGNKVRLETEMLGLYLPLSQVEIYNAMQEHGANPGLIYSATNLLGWGVSTYGPGTKKTTLEQDAFIWMGVDQSRYERDGEKKAPGWKIPKPKPLPTF